MIERIEHLNPLRFLKKLDLSANRIRVISGLRGLYNLEEVNLSGNKIVSLANLSQISGDSYKLKHIDLSGKFTIF
jgi:Leucine-rich repeat (LRR) protein